MIVNKKFDRFKQWGKERMGGEVATSSSDEFKALEMEMDLRQQGTTPFCMDRIATSSNAYIKSLSRRDCGDTKDKTTAIASFGSTLTTHGDDFEPDSDFGQCLLTLGRANERIARLQETYTANATGSWLESVERSQIQMKEYQGARKKLDQRRLAYDTASAKMQRSKREDVRMEEELRVQKAKYEESHEEVVRRMLDIKEAEADSVVDLGSLLDAELAYYDRCREILVQARRDWPAASNTNGGGYGNGAGYASSNRSASPAPTTISRRNTGTLSRSRASSITTNLTDFTSTTEPPRPTISNNRLPSGQNSPRRELPGFDLPARPAIPTRSASGFEGPTSLGQGRDPPMAAPPRLARMPTEPGHLGGARAGLRVTKRESVYDDNNGGGVFGDDSGSEVSESPGGYGDGAKKMAPPPPPSRSKKPPPPPPPMKRSALSTSEVPSPY